MPATKKQLPVEVKEATSVTPQIETQDVVEITPKVEEVKQKKTRKSNPDGLEINRENVDKVCRDLMAQNKEVNKSNVSPLFISPTSTRLAVYLADWKEENQPVKLTYSELQERIDKLSMEIGDYMTKNNELRNQVSTLQSLLDDAQQRLRERENADLLTGHALGKPF